MHYEFFEGFMPRISEVTNRSLPLWEQTNYQIKRDRTALHSLGYVYSGEGVLEYAGTSRLLVPGELFQLWPGHPMRVVSSREKPLAFYSYLFRYRVANWEQGTLSSEESSGPLPLKLGSAGGRKQEVEAEFRKTYEFWSAKESGYDWHVKLQLLNTLRLLQSLETSRDTDSSGKQAVQRAIERMKADFAQPLTRSDLAEAAAVSPGYFSSLFKAHTGISPIPYLNKIRIDYAKQLLRDTSVPVKEIAEQCGFEDSFYFSRLFHLDTGMSPRDYRNSI
ncbi:helix-turn-helix domain-containing protein [Paenibacillus agaridevorans]|uniref:helix-turn-helix domain-containing protein n=1 Tax=Paenibacillus agaridevorans TaxID=171404 RepID=UPI001BE3EC3E|nr:helix-turn-helix domain-containing protein [Paenibacillus agaridevorans]